MSATGSRSEPTRRRILEAAFSCFSEDGYAATSTRTVARLAEVNVATLNYHFGGKEALHHAVLDAAHDALAEFEPPRDLPADPASRIRAVVGAMYRFARSRRAALRLLLRTTLQSGALPEPLRRRQTADGLQRAQTLVAALDLGGASPAPLTLLSLNHLIVRYAVAADRAVEPFVASSVEDEIARHLGEVAVALLRQTMPTA